MHNQKSLIKSNFVSLDLEIHPENNDLLKIGAVAPRSCETICYKGKFNVTSSMLKLDEFCKDALFVIGHNISSHDIPWLKQHFPDLHLLSLPIIDTLYLSPLAFPKNPYHRLVKDYKIVRESVNDPVGDAALTISLLNDQIDAFMNMRKDVVGIYGYLLSRSYPADIYDIFFKALTGENIPDKEIVKKNILELIGEKYAALELMMYLI